MRAKSSRIAKKRRGGGTGRRTGLKILSPYRGVWVRFPSPALKTKNLQELPFWGKSPKTAHFARNFARKLQKAAQQR